MTGSRSIRIRGGIGLAVVVGLAAWAWSGWRPWGPDPALLAGIQVEPAGMSPSAGYRGVNASAIVDNKNAVAVDVIVRASARDAGGKVMAVEESGPINGLGPGGSRKVTVYFDMYPLRDVAFEVVRLQASREPGD